MAVNGQTARPGDQITVNISIDHGTISCNDQVSFHHLPRGESVVRVSALRICSGSGRGKRNRTKSSRHHDGEGRRAPETAAHEPHHYQSESGHCHDFHCASHCVPSFPKGTAEEKHREQISLGEACLFRLRLPRFDKSSPQRIRTTCTETKSS